MLPQSITYPHILYLKHVLGEFNNYSQMKYLGPQDRSPRVTRNLTTRWRQCKFKVISARGEGAAATKVLIHLVRCILASYLRCCMFTVFG